jgi:hypothetical protein
VNRHGHEDCTHGPGSAWTLEPDRRWFTRCDTCGRFRLWADYFEVYGARSNWWWECERCLLATVTAYAEEKARESKDRTVEPPQACYCCRAECTYDGCICELYAGRATEDD